MGERRWRAAGLAGLETLACVVVDGPSTRPSCWRTSWSRTACARTSSRSSRPGRSGRCWPAAASHSAASPSGSRSSPGSVSRALALLDLPAEIQEQIEAGQIAPATAYELAKVADPGEQAALATEAAAGRLTRDSAEARAGKPRKSRRAAKGRKVTARVFRKAAGCVVTVENAKGLDPETARAALAEAMARLDAELAAGRAAA